MSKKQAKTRAKPAKPFAHLHPDTRTWVENVLDEYALEPHHARLLLLAAESWDRCMDARKTIEKEGSVFRNRHDEPRVHPAIGVERDSRLAFVRIVRELALDVSSPAEPYGRAPTIGGRHAVTAFCWMSQLYRSLIISSPWSSSACIQASGVESCLGLNGMM